MSNTSALLIIDVQEGFINDATQHIPAVVEALQDNYELVFATRFINATDSPHRKWINWHRFGGESTEINLAFDLKDGAVVIDKYKYTCIDEGFLDKLRANGISEVHVCGIDTDACVLKCAVDLFEANIRPVVISSACASHAGADFHEYGLSILRRLIGKPQVDEE